MFALFNIIFATIAIVLDNVTGLANQQTKYGPIYGLYVLAMLLPGLAVSIRRLHDIGKSGWYIFISLVPFIGGIWLFVLLVTDSEPLANEYGPNPKDVSQNQNF